MEKPIISNVISNTTKFSTNLIFTSGVIISFTHEEIKIKRLRSLRKNSVTCSTNIECVTPNKIVLTQVVLLIVNSLPSSYLTNSLTASLMRTPMQ